jgi:hypothetical protein
MLQGKRSFPLEMNVLLVFQNAVGVIESLFSHCVAQFKYAELRPHNRCVFFREA